MNEAPQKRYVVFDDEDEVQEPEFKHLSAEEAADWRHRQPPESVWDVVRWQFLLGVLLVPLVWWWGHKAEWVWSLVYGVLCALLPTALMASGLTSNRLNQWVGRLFPRWVETPLTKLFFWEGMKILLAVTMLWLAPKFISELSWLALVAGLVVALKAYWLEFWMRSRRATRMSKIL